ncbi:receptor-like protein 47 isoform X2 [Cryptomeria japonica]|uniref:receptor-like protein 47 isoform X2 n=1 Tax=Cryptomeria japonica TaxID=3369 RepID=UPI0027DA9E39|nr:receptor-like protein 47 isoform X2 [Cryptomeria japonica]
MKMGLGIWVVLLLLPIICCSACFEDERKSLLDFKKGLNFTSSYRKLESWRGLNCCAWEGVGCHPRTAHVLSLDLHFFEWSEIRGRLFQLLNLEHLDLSENNLTMAGDTLLRSIASLTNLTTITMASCGLSGEIPPSFANLSRLQRLDLSGNSLRGMIPQGGQMMTFDSAYFSNNLGLCGLQIYVSCLSNPPDSPKEHEENDEDIEDDIWWDVGMATGYVISFSIVMGMLWVNKTCSIMCFKFMDGIIIGLFQTM